MKKTLFLLLFSFGIACGFPEFAQPRKVDLDALEAKYRTVQGTFDNALAMAEETYDVSIVAEHAPDELKYSIQRSYSKPRVLKDLREVCTGLEKNYEWFEERKELPLTPELRRALLQFEDQLNSLTGEEGYGPILGFVGVSHCYSPKSRHNREAE